MLCPGQVPSDAQSADLTRGARLTARRGALSCQQAESAARQLAALPTPFSEAHPTQEAIVKSLFLLALLVPALMLGAQRVMVVEELTRAQG
jgi:hypothetical protein